MTCRLPELTGIRCRIIVPTGMFSKSVIDGKASVAVEVMFVSTLASEQYFQDIFSPFSTLFHHFSMLSVTTY